MTTETINIINHLHLFAEADDTSAIMRFVFFLLMIAAVVGPYFLVPTLFRFVGGAFGRLAGLASKGEMSMFNRIKGKGTERRQTSKGWSRKQQLKELNASDRTRIGKQSALNSLDPEKQEGEGVVGAYRRRRAQYRRDGLGIDVGGRRIGKAGLQDSTVYAAEQEVSKQDLAEKSFALEKSLVDVKGQTFTVTHADGTQEFGVEKDDMLAAQIKGARTVNEQNGVVASEGAHDVAAQRAAAMKAAQQGLVAPINEVEEEVARQRAAAVDPTKSQAERDQSMKRARDLGNVVSEAMGAHVQTMMPKMPSYYKGKNQAFGTMSAGDLSKFHPSEGKRMVKWVGDRSNFTNEHGTYEKEKHEQAVARVAESIRLVAENPEKYNASPELLQTVRNELDATPIPDAMVTDRMNDAIAAINARTGAIDR